MHTACSTYQCDLRKSNPYETTYLARQTPAGVKSLFGEMLNIFMVSQIRTTSATAVFTQEYHTPNLLFQTSTKNKKIRCKRYFDSSCVCFFNSEQQPHTDRLRKVSSFACLLAGTASTLGRLSCFFQPHQRPAADPLAALDTAETRPARHTGVPARGSLPSSTFH